MSLIDIMKKRRSVRSYDGSKVDPNVLKKVITAGLFAASARNVQPWKFIVVTEKKMIDDIAHLTPNAPFLRTAPVCVAVFCEDTRYYLEDGCAATQNILNAATAEGLGSCWIAGDKKDYCDQISEMLHAPEGMRLVSMISIGHPSDDDALHESPKKAFDDVVHWESF